MPVNASFVQAAAARRPFRRRHANGKMEFEATVLYHNDKRKLTGVGG
jgi:hypothetical protein